jgi:hypothetical protein
MAYVWSVDAPPRILVPASVICFALVPAGFVSTIVAAVANGTAPTTRNL